LSENGTKHLLFLIKQILLSTLCFFFKKIPFNVETFVKFQKSGLELLKNLANVFVQKSAKTNLTPFSHLSALRVSTSLIFLQLHCVIYLVSLRRAFALLKFPLTPRVSVCLQQLIIN
jgi:hypothetical protein